jgi:dTDP-4-dehydrorhamnose reductase
VKYLLLGKTGQLGWELNRCLPTMGEVIVWDYPEVDFRRIGELKAKIQTLNPDVIINAVAYTAVDKAENEREAVMQINAAAPGELAGLSRQMGIPFIHYSTDYVFDGQKGSPYTETDAPNPLNLYGWSKLDGEKAVSSAGGAYLTLRTSWVYSTRRDSFVTKVLQWSRQQPSLRMVTDQVGSPTWARFLAEATAQVLLMTRVNGVDWLTERSGLYHLAGDGGASRLDWAQAILEMDPDPAQRLAKEILPALTAEFPTPAQRPLYTVLDCTHFQSTFGLRFPPWREALRLAMTGIG